MHEYHLIVWIDHTIAKIYAMRRDHVEEVASVHASDIGHGHIHHKTGTPGSGHTHPTTNFLRDITTALEQSHEILIVGPSDAKYALEKFIKMHSPTLGTKIVGVEAMERVTPSELHAFAKLVFRKTDLMGGPQS